MNFSMTYMALLGGGGGLLGKLGAAGLPAPAKGGAPAKPAPSADAAGAVAGGDDSKPAADPPAKTGGDSTPAADPPAKVDSPAPSATPPADSPAPAKAPDTAAPAKAPDTAAPAKAPDTAAPTKAEKLKKASMIMDTISKALSAGGLSLSSMITGAVGTGLKGGA
ncbi:hypothetical protein PGT21_018336 [Puccinia graminis f. sp. tritici]|uniref:Uncharacterized protein n=1 Tax=Puccinia graminis f. sp. tritici TaxID=56615 RepID=A0A5B0P042_PUCGR|nr:hypothetical protein PGTUg99_019290 [Puccinia graminis f. sp. tritici]KAA1094346.1 hypothetical protein PGT21_018336 [Puccinia graminis f. sp. tritici]